MFTATAVWSVTAVGSFGAALAVQDALFPSIGPSAASVWQNPGRTPDATDVTIATFEVPPTTLAAPTVPAATTLPAPVSTGDGDDQAAQSNAIVDDDDRSGRGSPVTVPEAHEAADGSHQSGSGSGTGSGEDDHSGGGASTTAGSPSDGHDDDVAVSGSSGGSGSGSGSDRSGAGSSGSGGSGSGGSGSGGSGSGGSGSGGSGSGDDPDD
jgi:hypothetical protein